MQSEAYTLFLYPAEWCLMLPCSALLVLEVRNAYHSF